jgi:hypothetical protein
MVYRKIMNFSFQGNVFEVNRTGASMYYVSAQNFHFQFEINSLNFYYSKMKLFKSPDAARLVSRL